jgi:hypothetical protein
MALADFEPYLACVFSASQSPLWILSRLNPTLGFASRKGTREANRPSNTT